MPDAELHPRASPGVVSTPAKPAIIFGTSSGCTASGEPKAPPLNIASSGVHDRLSVIRFDPLGHGTVTRKADGTLRYSPKRGFSGTDEFTYVVGDGEGGSDAATVRVTVREVTAPKRSWRRACA